MIPFAVLYLTLMGILLLYGTHRYWLAWGAFMAGRRRRASAATRPPVVVPRPVLIQLPIYNEGEEVLELLRSAAELDYPRELLQIQVLDDSDDGSEQRVAAAVASWRARGVSMEHVRRASREGYKAGALAEGLQRAAASESPPEFVAIFDADFVVPSDFLTAALAEFSDDRVGMVQARWGFLNEKSNLLTRVQALMLDGHFAVEHQARAGAERFFNFNGTAGVWRIEAIADAGGWNADTITEDLDLSIRAWLRGWRFRYMDDLVVPSQLPETISAFKVQQNRWVSGSLQTAKKCLPIVLRSTLPWRDKLDLGFYLTGNLTYLMLFLLTLAVPVAVLLRLDGTPLAALWADVPFFAFATLSVLVFYGCARRGRRVLPFFCGRVPALMALGLGMSAHNSRAACRGLFGRSRVFERTPKGGRTRELAARFRRLDWVSCVEPLMIIYLVVPLAVGVAIGRGIGAIPFALLFVLGYLFVFVEARRGWFARRGRLS
ncbi:MAG: glycosyltransferase family 2 protein [Planctomycetota bacterium]